MKIVTLLSCIAVAALMLRLSGCSSAASVPPNSSPSSLPNANVDHTHAEHAGHDRTTLSDMEKMQAELAKLSPEDAASAALGELAIAYDEGKSMARRW